MLSSTRQAVAVDATVPNSSGRSRSTASPLIPRPPSASITVVDLSDSDTRQ